MIYEFLQCTHDGEYMSDEVLEFLSGAEEAEQASRQS